MSGVSLPVVAAASASAGESEQTGSSTSSSMGSSTPSTSVLLVDLALSLMGALHSVCMAHLGGQGGGALLSQHPVSSVLPYESCEKAGRKRPPNFDPAVAWAEGSDPLHCTAHILLSTGTDTPVCFTSGLLAVYALVHPVWSQFLFKREDVRALFDEIEEHPFTDPITAWGEAAKLISAGSGLIERTPPKPNTNDSKNQKQPCMNHRTARRVVPL